MSMIKCPECQKKISSMAANCPNCGCPITMETESIISQQPYNTGEQSNNMNEMTEVKKRSIFCSKKILIPMIVILIFVLSGSIFVGIKFNSAKKLAIQLNNSIDEIGEIVVTSESTAGQTIDIHRLSKEAQEALQDRNKLDAFLNKLYGFRNSYDKMSDFQKKYITSYDNLEEVIEWFERKKSMFELSDKIEENLNNWDKVQKELNDAFENMVGKN